MITAGGVVGSFWGWREVLSGRKGDLIPLYGSSSSILVRDFEIVTSRTMEIKDYISSVSVLGEDGDTLKTADIEVNHPLKFGRYEIYQNGYHIDEKIFDWAIIGYTVRGSATSNLVTIKPGEEVGLEGTELTLRVMSFFPDFRRSAKGPYTASGNMANPALEIEIASEDGVERGWLFYFYPRYNSRFSFPVNINLVELEPLFYTELQISTDPGAPVFLVGIMIGTLGTLMLYMFNYRSIKGFVGRERLVVVGVEYRWKLSFGNEFMELGRLLRAELSVVLHSGTRG